MFQSKWRLKHLRRRLVSQTAAHYRRRSSGRASTFWRDSPRCTNRMPVVTNRSLFCLPVAGLLVYLLLVVTCHANQLLSFVTMDESKLIRYWPLVERLG